MLHTYTCIKSVVVVGLIAALTPALAVLWAQPVQQQQTLTPPGGMEALPPAAAQGGLVWFTSQGGFEAFNQLQGKVLKGIEDFEESTLPPNTFDTFDDPLESGIPNLPDGFPFPDGMTGLPNLILQSIVCVFDPSF